MIRIKNDKLRKTVAFLLTITCPLWFLPWAACYLLYDTVFKGLFSWFEDWFYTIEEWFA